MRTPQSRTGFSLAELVVVIVLIGIATAIVLPRFSRSSSQRAYSAARQMAADLELVRSRAAASASNARMLFNVGGDGYDAYLDSDRNGVFTYARSERDSLRVFSGRSLETSVHFGRGSRAAIAGFPPTNDISFAGTAVTFDPRGLVRPIGAAGVVYLRTDDTPDALAAVTVTGSGNVRVWRWIGGGWR